MKYKSACLSIDFANICWSCSNARLCALKSNIWPIIEILSIFCTKWACLGSFCLIHRDCLALIGKKLCVCQSIFYTIKTSGICHGRLEAKKAKTGSLWHDFLVYHWIERGKDYYLSTSSKNPINSDAKNSKSVTRFWHKSNWNFIYFEIKPLKKQFLECKVKSVVYLDVMQVFWLMYCN